MTLLRTLRLIDATILERAISDLSQALQTEQTTAQIVTPCGTILTAQALDGKALRGTNACGAKTHLLSLVQHGSGLTLAQTAVPHKRSELTAAPILLHGRDLTDTIITMDALHTHRPLAQDIHQRNGFYFMIVKANQALLRDDLAFFFSLQKLW